MPSSWSIRNYLIAIVLALALPLFGLLAYSLNNNYQKALSNAKSSSLHLSQMIATDASRSISDARVFLEGLAQRPRIQRHDATDCDPLLTDIKQLFPDFANLAVLDPNGQMVCSALMASGGQLPSFAEMSWFKEARAANQFHIGKPHMGPISKKWVVVLAQPFHGTSGQFDGLLGYSLDLARFQPLARYDTLASGLRIHLVDSNGFVVGGLRLKANELGQPYANREVLEGLKTAGAAIISAGGRQNLVSGADIAGTHWKVISSQPANEVFDELWFEAKQEYLVAVLLISVGLLFALYVSRKIVQPVKHIASIAQRVAEGELSQRANHDGPREVFAVARQFNQMLEVRLKAEAQYRDLLESATDSIVVFNQDSIIVLTNNRAEHLFGYAHGELLGQSIEVLVPQDSRGEHRQLMARYFEAPRRQLIGRVIRGQRKNGQVFSCDIGLSPVQTEDGMLVSAVIQDLTERIEFQQQLAHLANHDALTNLPNRALLPDRLEQAIARAERSAGQIAVIHADIDGFTELNDFHGTAVADRILQLSATYIRAALRDTDTVVRSGSDEFVILLEDKAADAAALNFVDRLRSAFTGSPFMAQSDPIHLTLSCGIALYPSDGADTGPLLKNADLALIHAKQDGGDVIRFFEEEMDARASRRIELLSRLRGALDRKELFLDYQPQVDLSNGRIVGVEALLRWRSPELGLVSPARFIPLAEESGIIDAIGEWVLREACAQGVRWLNAGLPPVTVAVNLSARQFRQNRLVGLVESALLGSGLPARQLELEITEGMLMQNPESAVATLYSLHHMGPRISIDDFGTGYSSLSYLKRFPVQVLKIDQSFVRDVPGNADDEAIVSAIVSLAHSLRLGVIAEGVETEVQRDFLAGLGCELCQGYLFSRPLSPEQISMLLRAQGTYPVRECPR